MVTTQGNELFTDRAPTVVLSFAISSVGDYPLHFVTRRRSAIGISALTGMYQALYTSLDRRYAVWIAVCLVASATGISSQIKPKPIHFVGMAITFVTIYAKVEIVALGAMISRFHALGAIIACVDELVLALRMKFVQ